jgi:preprotein translocase subunit SecD
MNQYPLWKNLLILAVILVGLLFALPNLFPQDPSIEVTGTRDAEITDSSIGEIKAAMENAGVPVKAVERREGNKLLVRFTDAE